MSGSQGPDYPVGAGAGGDNCAGLRREKPLAAPDPDLVAQLAVGQVLQLVLGDEPHPPIAAVDDDGNEVGAVPPDPVLVECLKLGHPFHATVRSINGGAVMLTIEPS